jgi:signal transduction histidine kinase
MRRLRRWYEGASLQTKFALQVVLSTTLLFSILLPLVLYLQRQAILSNVEDAGFQLAKVFARSSVQAVVADDYLVMQHVVNGIGSERKVLYAMLLGDGGRVLVHTRVNERGTTYSDPLSTAAVNSKGPLLQRYLRPDGVRVYDFSVPVFVLDERRATARIGLSIQKELADIVRTRNSIILLGLGALAVGVAWATYRARRLTRPVGALVRGTEEIARGNLGHRISVGGGREFRQLAAAFNQMTQSVQALIETSRQLSSTLDLDAVLRSVTAYALELVKADSAAIALVDRETRQASLRVVLGARTNHLQGIPVTPGRGLGGAVLSRGTAVLSHDYLNDPEIAHDPLYDEVCREEGVVAAAAVPITLRGDIVGVLWVANRTSTTFTRENIDTLERMASQAAIAIENARLYQDLKRSHEGLIAAESQLVNKTRMAAIGEISAVVAHEARNPLGAISNCVQMLRTNPHITGEDLELLEIVQAESQRLNEIISDFLTFGRPRAPRFEPVVLQEAIEDTLVLLRRDQRCGATIAFSTKFEAGVPPVEADRDQLRQVFWNLFLNAVQAMGDRGQLRVEVRRQGDVAEIEIHDSGRGISRSVQPRIFEPFYTTRPGGTGLGLATVRHIIEEHHGEIRVESEVGIGTCFTVTLPFDQTTS